MEESPRQVTPTKSRKKSSNPSRWKRSLAKESRYKPSNLSTLPTCTDSLGSKQCLTLTMRDLKLFHGSFYATPDKLQQDAFILKFCKSIPVKRHRPTNGSHARKLFQTRYFVRQCDGPLVSVCLDTFLKALCITRCRVNTVIKNFSTSGCFPKENRGGNAFYELVREKDAKIITFCIDCEKNLAMPKVPDQICYYCRQLYLYNFTITVGSSKAPFTKDNTFCYTWTEDEHKKGSNEIASALYHRLTSTNYSGKSVVRLIADGCSGQNKNTTVITACSVWLVKDAPSCVECVELVFPVTGHSFIPPDRVFGQIEKKN